MTATTRLPDTELDRIERENDVNRPTFTGHTIATLVAEARRARESEERLVALLKAVAGRAEPIVHDTHEDPNDDDWCECLYCKAKDWGVTGRRIRHEAGCLLVEIVEAIGEAETETKGDE